MPDKILLILFNFQQSIGKLLKVFIDVVLIDLYWSLFKTKLVNEVN